MNLSVKQKSSILLVNLKVKNLSNISNEINKAFFVSYRECKNFNIEIYAKNNFMES